MATASNLTTITAEEPTVRARALALVEQAGRVPTITDDETSGRAGDLVKLLTAAAKKLDEVRDGKVRPLNEEVRAINASFKGIAGQIADAKAAVGGKITAYLTEKQREIKRLADIAAKEAQEKALAEAAAREAEGDKVSAEQALEAAITAPVAVHVQSRGNYGSTTSLRSTWSAKVVDFAALPDTYKVADMSTLGALARGSRPAIPGVEWVETQTAVSR